MYVQVELVGDYPCSVLKDGRRAKNSSAASLQPQKFCMRETFTGHAEQRASLQ